MYREINILETIPDNCIVRRYMNLAKFLHIIQTNSLFFPSLELLAKEDKFEGLFNLVDHPLPQLAEQINNDFQRNYRKHCFVNCWNVGINESYALWKIYIDSSGDGIAIETTSQKLKNSFRNFPEDIFMGKVRYASSFYAGSRFFTVTTKRSQFDYEQEARLIYEKVPTAEDGTQQVSIPPQRKGHYIPLDLQVLFGRVITSPFASSWFHDLIRGVMSRYSYSHVEVKKSSLSIEPI